MFGYSVEYSLSLNQLEKNIMNFMNNTRWNFEKAVIR